MTGINLESLGFEPDLTTTRERNASFVPESSQCNCSNCRNLVAARRTSYFEPVASFLRSAGADPEKDTSCQPEFDEAEGSSWYQLSYELWGRLKVEPSRDWEFAGDGLMYYVWGHASEDPSKSLTLMLKVRLPWVLVEAKGEGHA